MDSTYECPAGTDATVITEPQYPVPPASTLLQVNADAGRTWHYRDLYRPPGTPPAEDRPLWLVVGNCQAEALRVVLDSVVDRPYRTARIPPVHELERSDLPHLQALLSETAVLLSQPIRANYRDLPIGTTDLAAALPAGSTLLRWPVIRYAGLFPFQVIVRHPADRSVTPPVVPYHDLRTLVAARDGSSTWEVDVSAEAIRAVATASIDELARRERRDTDVGVSDVLAGHGAAAAHTINHPGNPVLVDLAARILSALGAGVSPHQPQRTLLSSVYAPLEERVLQAHGVAAPPRHHWVVNGEQLPAHDVHTAQLSWYRDNPDYIELAEQRHGHVLDLLGLSKKTAS